MSITLDTIDAGFHSIKISDGTDTLAIAADGSIAITDNGGSLTVDGTVELGAASLAALESITVQNGSGAGAVNIQDGGNSITVDAADLDIRDLTHVSDSVKIGDGTDFLAVNADGSINTVNTPGGYSVWQTGTDTVTTTAGQLDGTPLAGRLAVEIQNLGNSDVYLGPANTVTTANGLKLPRGSSQSIELDAGAQIWAITAAGTADVRLAEYAN